MQDAGTGEAHYRAFVSYSHRDQAFGRRLHRRLERYAVPRRLVGRLTPRGPTPKRVAPVFRDREELSAAHDLSAEIREALASSGALIVVCTPNAAASPWVAREIELFRELHPDRPVLAALAAGEPVQAFPRSLTVAGGAPVEPLAADFRREGDGARLALLKLVAGVLGVRLDELVQRDAQRRLRGVMAVTGAAVAGAVAMSGLTTYALVARAEAQRQRAEAEALVEFMLTDLRDRLKGVGRLDVLTAVNERTLAYYRDQDVERLPADSQARYARILLAMGEDDLARGDARAADAKFERASVITARLLQREPRDLERIWARAQAEYWLGYRAYQDARTKSSSAAASHAVARRHWDQYAALARTLALLAPDNARYRREHAYAEGNLCTLALRRPHPDDDALDHCRRSLQEMVAVSRMGGAHPYVASDVMNRHAWLADAYAARGDWIAARRERLAQERLLTDLRSADPMNVGLKLAWVGLQRGLAQAELNLEQRDSAERRIQAALRLVSDLVESDPANASWRRRQRTLEVDLVVLKRQELKR